MKSLTPDQYDRIGHGKIVAIVQGEKVLLPVGAIPTTWVHYSDISIWKYANSWDAWNGPPSRLNTELHKSIPDPQTLESFIKADHMNIAWKGGSTFESIREDIVKNGLRNPIQLRSDGTIEKGNHRYVILREYRVEWIPCFLSSSNALMNGALNALIDNTERMKLQRTAIEQLRTLFQIYDALSDKEKEDFSQKAQTQVTFWRRALCLRKTIDLVPLGRELGPMGSLGKFIIRILQAMRPAGDYGEELDRQLSSSIGPYFKQRTDPFSIRDTSLAKVAQYTVSYAEDGVLTTERLKGLFERYSEDRHVVEFVGREDQLRFQKFRDELGLTGSAFVHALLDMWEKRESQ